MQHLTGASPTSARRITVLQGTSHVTRDVDVVLTTVLGSCVACCLYDARARVGGMNHFLLAEPGEGARFDKREAERFGLYAMELLINEMLKAGGSRNNLRAHLYGGANLHPGMQAIGTANAVFAKGFLERDGIPLIHEDLGGVQARRVDFKAASGQARSRCVDAEPVEVRKPPLLAVAGEVELF